MNNRVILIIVLMWCSAFAKAELKFCSGQKGNAIFEEDGRQKNIHI